MKKLISLLIVLSFLILKLAGQNTIFATDPSCGNLSVNSGNIQPNQTLTFTITGAQNYAGKQLYIRLYNSSDQSFVSSGQGIININASGTGTATLFGGVLVDPGSYFAVASATPITDLNSPPNQCSNTLPSITVGGKPAPLLSNPVEEQKAGINNDVQGRCGDGYIDTAIGCIPFTNTTSLISFILRWALGIAGGIAFLLILVAGFQIMTSRGDPNRLKAGQELLTSAIAGLILLIFSVFILRVIGVDILKIQGFGSGSSTQTNTGGKQ